MLPNTEKKRRQRGAAMVEFTIAGVAALTLMVSTVQIGLGMWNYHTLAYAVHETNRYISTHGRNCSLGGNTCTITVADIANKMINNGVGLPSGSVIMTLTSNSGTVYTCNPVSSCTSDSTQWPPIAHLDNYTGKYSQVTSTYTFNSAAVAMWYGWRGQRISSITLKSTSKIKMLF
jgi:Flp pilus assembly protein TadG